MTPQDFIIREPKASDFNFIHSTFLKSVHKESKLGKSVTASVFFPEFSKVIDYILNNQTVIVACSSENDDIILGYLIHDDETVYFAFVKLAFRRLHIGRDLLFHAFAGKQSVQYTFNTN